MRASHAHSNVCSFADIAAHPAAIIVPYAPDAYSTLLRGGALALDASCFGPHVLRRNRAYLVLSIHCTAIWYRSVERGCAHGTTFRRHGRSAVAVSRDCCVCKAIDRIGESAFSAVTFTFGSLGHTAPLWHCNGWSRHGMVDSHSRRHTHARAHARARTHTHTHTRARALTHTSTHPHTLTHTHTNTRTHKRTRTCLRVRNVGSI